MATISDFTAPMTGLPDPDLDRQFYNGVPTRRFLAWCVDATLIFLAGLLATLFFGIFTLGFGFALAPFIFLGISFAYRTATLANHSATWGMRLMGIEFRRADGTRFDGVTAAAHTALYLAFFSLVFLQAVSVVLILTTRYGQGLQDMVLRCAAINCPAD